MNEEFAVVDQQAAQALFDALPAEMRWPTLSPAYVAADANRDPALLPVFMASRQGDGFLMHAVHESPVAIVAGCDWQSAYGYGGPIAHGLDADGWQRAWRGLDTLAAQRRVVAEFVRFHPMTANHAHYPGTVSEDRAVCAIDLSSGDMLASYSGRARTAVRKAQRLGLQATWETPEDACALFPDFYRSSMREIGADEHYLFGDSYFESVLRLPGARVLQVAHGGERVSMGLFLFGPKQVEYHLSGTTPAGRQAGATNLLLHIAAEAGQAAGCSALYLGGGTSASADDPLLRFKASFAPAGLSFRIGHRIHDPAAYARLRAAYPALASGSRRVLFYRS